MHIFSTTIRIMATLLSLVFLALYIFVCALSILCGGAISSIFFVPIILFCIFFIEMRFSRARSEINYELDIEQKKILEYIEKTKQAGLDDKTIENNLIKGGWDKPEVLTVFKYYIKSKK